jgi:membrane-bound lytic murein transglycosylase MltF
MIKTLSVLLFTVNVFAQFSPKAPKPASGCVVPYQQLFIQIDGKNVWVARAAQVWVESGFNPKARSPGGDMGLAQFTRATWKKFGKGSAYDPKAAITAQNKYMGYLTIICKNDLTAAIGSYNCGEGNVSKAKYLAKKLRLQGKDAWLRVLPRITGRCAKITRNYVVSNQKKRAQITAMLKG